MFGGSRFGKQVALTSGVCLRMMSVMFKITQSALRDFTLAEVLLMAAMNQLEAKRNVGASGRSMPDTGPFRAKVA